MKSFKFLPFLLIAITTKAQQDTVVITSNSGSSNQISYWSAKRKVTGSATLTYSPTASFSVNNSVTASGAIAQERMRIKSNGQVRFLPLASAPSGAEAGDVYYDSTLNKLRVYTTAWETITSV